MKLTKLSNLFEIKYGVNLELFSLEENNKRNKEFVPFVSRTENNNGVSAFVKKQENVVPISADTITVAAGGSVLSTFLQPYEYYSGRDLFYLTPKKDMTERELIYYSICIKRNKYKYNYGRQANKTLKDILVPESVPEKFLKIQFNNPSDEPLSENKVMLSERRWEWFAYKNLFEIKKGKRLTKGDMVEGTVPFVGSSEMQNGITAYIDKKPDHKGNTISVTYNGSVGEAFYQPDDFCASDDVNVLYPKFELNAYVALFLISLIKKEKYRFSYGRKWHLERMKESKIKLPVDENGNPDWQFMEDYIKSLPYSASI